MRGSLLILCCFLLNFLPGKIFSQTENIKLDAEKIKTYTPYVEARHGIQHDQFESWKQVNMLQFTKEIWYFSESFYIKKNHLKSGVELNPANIDISRYETHRKENEEFVLVLPGFCDAIVLLPSKKLIYKP